MSKSNIEPSEHICELPEYVKKEAVKAFRLLDVGEKGYLNIDEFRKMIRSAGINPTEKELEELFKERDTDGNGELSLEECMEAARLGYDSKKEGNSKENLECAFRILDSDGNGYIDRSELQTVMTTIGEPLSEEELTEFFNRCDKDGNGKLDINEMMVLLEYFTD